MMTQGSSRIDNRFDALIKAATSCQQISDSFNQLDQLNASLDEKQFLRLTTTSDNILEELEAARLFRNQEYCSLLDISNTIEAITNSVVTLDQCIDNSRRYNEALDILEILDKLDKEHSHDVPLVATICKKIPKRREYLIVNLLNHLDDQREATTDELRHIVYLLERCGRFSDRDLRLRFLQARDYWFNNECEARSESFEELITFFCKGLPKIFEEFNKIFGDASIHATDDEYLAVNKRDSTREDGAMINSWLLLKTSTFILSLETHFVSIGKSKVFTPTMIRDTMEKCFRLTNWLASIGFDFSSQLRPLFARAIIEEFKFSVDRATIKFETEFTSIVSKSIESLLLPIDDEILRISNMRQEEEIPKPIEHYTVFKIYCLHIIDSLRWIRASQDLMSPINLCIDVYGSLNASLSRVMQAIAVILNTDNNSSHPILSKISVLFTTEVIPFMSSYCERIFPDKIILSAMGLSKTEFKALCIKEPDRMKNLRLNPQFLDKFQRQLAGRPIAGV